jgi:prepilin-type N-terminal cleavage/methylation domain-containing protein
MEPAMKAGRCEGGFSLIEVLVTVTIVGAALGGILTIMRAQMRALDALRTHQEARLVLERAVDRFQYGDGLAPDSLVNGKYAAYSLSLHDDPDPAACPIELRRAGLETRKIAIRWTVRGQEQMLIWSAWRMHRAHPSPSLAGWEGR